MTREHLASGRVTLFAGDCLDVLAGMPENSVDAVVTDPPYLLNFMAKKWDRAKVAEIDPDFANWLAGFIDGEGCFSVHKKNVNGFETFDCQFTITLRDDDRSVIETIKRELGGIGTIALRPARDGNAQVRYCISSQRDCLRLREILMVFPLRAKKLRDFEIWSRALDSWINHEKGEWEDMAYFRRHLMAVKRYGSHYHPEQLFHYEWARQVYRVLKPGGHMLAMGGTRTFHRLVCAIEDAGFEVRDTVMWVYGSGFPKSRDVSKGIDRNVSAGRIGWFGEWLRAERERRGISQKDLAERGKFFKNVNHGGLVANWELGYGIPTAAEFNRVCDILQLPFQRIEEAEREVIGKRNVNAGVAFSSIGPTELEVTAPATDAAREWDGWGTALKPAVELICLARKPLSEGTIAANVLAHGTGAIHVDACRVGVCGQDDYGRSAANANGTVNAHNGFDGKSFKISERDGEYASPLGRWPANLIHDGSDEVLAAFPETEPAKSSMRGEQHSSRHGGLADIGGNIKAGTDSLRGHEDNGGSAARFFKQVEPDANRLWYSSKADADDRLGSKHPTVKPVDLIQYLARLITPPGGLILDCFAGTGTLGEAAIREGFRAVLIEREAAYCADIRRRMTLASAGPVERRHESIKARGKVDHDAGPLFAQVEAAE